MQSEVIGELQRHPSNDGCVRSCQLSYKQTRPGLVIPQHFTTIERPVQNLVVIVPTEEQLISLALECFIYFCDTMYS